MNLVLDALLLYFFSLFFEEPYHREETIRIKTSITVTFVNIPLFLTTVLIKGPWTLAYDTKQILTFFRAEQRSEIRSKLGRRLYGRRVPGVIRSDYEIRGSLLAS